MRFKLYSKGRMALRDTQLSPQNFALPRLRNLTSVRKTGWILLVSDVVALAVAGLLSFFIRYMYDRSLLWELYLPLWPMLLMFPIAYALTGLYPGVGINPPEELRRITYTSLLVFAVIGASTFIYRTGADYSRGAFVFAVVLVPISVPLARALTRQLFASKPWWGTGVVVFGAAQTGADVVRSLMGQPGLGLRPVAMLDDDPSKHGQTIEGIPVLGGLDLAPRVVKEYRVSYAILAMPGVPRGRLLEIFQHYGVIFRHLVLIPDLFGLGSLWVSARDLGGRLGLEVRQRLLMPGPRWLKRALDLFLIVLAAPLVLLLGVVIALLIRLDSPGPVLYNQERIGCQGRRFRAWKFRSMVQDADQVLQAYLHEHPELRAEWARDHKLRDDPRITRAGHFLRKTSLDELPQLWNVLRSEMSLVGPRPIVQAEVERYGEQFALYLRVTPGLTGLWQVSGRNDTTYQERVSLDAYYVRNWSVWLDLYIIARTVWAVTFSRGAY